MRFKAKNSHKKLVIFILVTGQIVAGQIVADKSLRTIRRMDKMSHGQIVAWTNRRKDK
jgi:hypothetical protein